ncbi:MAG: helix-turn-helix domain-containing protein [Oscillospiraceae bacterium]|nr:helix-turn-helix domain-containing protein [Oscillospiraceae bacterium]
MNSYVTGAAIKSLRESKHLTQAELAEQLGVSDKAVSKWETGKGFPDSSLLQPLAAALGVSVIELLNGKVIVNRNASGNLLRSKWYVCPVCGNVIHTTGDAVISCCGVTLPPLEAEDPDDAHALTVEKVEDEHFLTIHHPMTKQHYISFMAFVTSDRLQLVKLYPEGEAQTRLSLRGRGFVYFYCNKHGLFQQKI